MQKSLFCAGIGAVGSAIAAALGGWDTALQTLLIFMGVDYLSGLVLAGVFHKSNKSESGSLESLAGWKGLARKCGTLLLVLIAHMLDLLTGTEFIRDAVILFFVSNEALSIIENAGLMGVPIPKVLSDAIEVLNRKGDGKKENPQ